MLRVTCRTLEDQAQVQKKEQSMYIEEVRANNNRSCGITVFKLIIRYRHLSICLFHSQERTACHLNKGLVVLRGIVVLY